MIDTSTRKKLNVTAGGTSAGYIMVPMTQLATLRALFDRNHVPYAVDENTISLDDEPEVAILNLGRKADPKFVQGLLDQQP